MVLGAPIPRSSWSRKLQEAFAANTSIKFAGGVSARRTPETHCPDALLRSRHSSRRQAEGQLRRVCARRLTRSALPLEFPLRLPRKPGADGCPKKREVLLTRRHALTLRRPLHPDLDGHSEACRATNPMRSLTTRLRRQTASRYGSKWSGQYRHRSRVVTSRTVVSD